MPYFVVQNGCILAGPVERPATWDGVKNFNELPDTALVQYGWLLAVEGDVKSPTVAGTTVLVPCQVIDIESVRMAKLQEIYDSFTQALQYGQMMTSGLSNNYLIDCRRNGKDNDLQNLDSIISLLQLGLIAEPLNWVGVVETRQLTLSQLQQLRTEMLAYGVSVYQRKHELEAQASAAATVDELAAITW